MIGVCGKYLYDYFAQSAENKNAYADIIDIGFSDRTDNQHVDGHEGETEREGGVLEPDDPEFEKKYATLSRGYLPFRINHWSWWKQELPSEEEMEEGRQNLEKHDNKVDFIVTHSCAASTQALLGHGLYSKDYLNEYLEEIRQKCKFKKWFFGHYHDNRNVNAEEILIWEQIIRIV